MADTITTPDKPLKVEPEGPLEFTVPNQEEQKQLKITNENTQEIVYKFQTSLPQNFRFSNFQGTLKPGESTDVTITFHDFDPSDTKARIRVKLCSLYAMASEPNINKVFRKAALEKCLVMEQKFQINMVDGGSGGGAAAAAAPADVPADEAPAE